MNSLELKRALAFFDLETTGIDPLRDKIVELAIIRVDPGGGRLTLSRRINPGRPIPAEATAVHGISDADVASAPAFRDVAREVLDLLKDADLSGFNVRRFDVPLLDREFRECGLDLALASRRIVDVMTIFHRKEPRDLTAAVRFFLDREHAGAHGAEADVVASIDVLEAQLSRYPDLPRTVDDLDLWANPVPPGAVDRGGKFVLKEGEVVFAFGKQKGRALNEVARVQRDYLEWILKQDFPEDARSLVVKALRGGTMISTTDFKRGARILVEGEPYQIEDYSVQSPSARGAATLVRCKLRHVVTSSLLDKTFKAGEKFDEPDVALRQVQFLFGDGESSHFMELLSYEQFAIPNERIEDIVPWLTDGLNLNAVYWNGAVAGISLPQYVEAEVDMAGGGSKSDMASGKNMKDASLTNGLTIRVPLFVESGERVVVDPRTLEFIRRAAK